MLRVAQILGCCLASGLMVLAACTEVAEGQGANFDAAGPTLVTLDSSTRFQTIDAWPVYPRYWEQDKKNNRYDGSYVPLAERISRYLVNEVGINGARVEIWSGLENPTDHWSRFISGQYSYKKDKVYRYEKINDNDDPFVVNPAGFQFAKFDHRFETMVLPLKRAVEANGERFHINVNYVDFKWGAEQGPLSHADNPEEFAEFVLVFFQRLRDKYGVVPDSFEIVLEPDNTHDWRGREIGRALIAVKRRLNAEGFAPEFVAPSAAYMPNTLSYFDQMLLVPGALEALDVLAYHRYGREGLVYVEGVRRRAKIFKLKTAMLEKVGAGVDKLLEDLTLVQVSAWQQWGVASLASRPGAKGATYLIADLEDPADPSIRMAPATRHLSQVFKHVRAGAVRIAAASDNPDKRPVAFINKNGAWAVIVRAKEAGGALSIAGLPAGTYGLRFTGDEGLIEDWPGETIAAGQTLSITLPGRGVIAVYADPGS